MRVNILLYVAQNPGIGLKELADHFAVSRAAITQNIKILSAAEFDSLKAIRYANSLETVVLRKAADQLTDIRFIIDN